MKAFHRAILAAGAAGLLAATTNAASFDGDAAGASDADVGAIIGRIAETSLKARLPGPSRLPRPEGIQTPETNKKAVLDFFRIVFEAHNADAAADFLKPDYIQHNPLVPTGRDGFIRYFKPILGAPRPVKPELENPPALVLADDQYALIMWKEIRPEPGDASRTYESFWFDLFRFEGGKIAEHWDNQIKPKP